MYPPNKPIQNVNVNDPNYVDKDEPVDPPKQEKFTDEEIKNAFEDLLKDARNEDRYVREEYVRMWKRLEYYWENILDIFQDPVSKDWRVPKWEELEDEIPARLINIYRPHGEAIVAALSVTIPSIVFHPDDAEEPNDLEMARAYRDISELLKLHNRAPMMFIKMIMIMFNQGTIFGYNYLHEDSKYGKFSKPKIDYQDIDLFEAYCSNCAEPLDAGRVGNEETEYNCDSCGYSGPGSIISKSEQLPQIVGFSDHPKSSVCQDIFSGMFVKIPAYVKKQEECGYLLLEFVQSIPLLRDIFEEKAEKINSRKTHEYDDSFSRIPLQYLGELPDNAANVSCLWLRPWQFWQLGVEKKELIKDLKEKYPEGVYAVFINDEFIEAYAENMDEHWTISDNPLGNYLYAKPLGENLSTVQDIRAELVEIEIQTAEHGIPETFADGKVLDFKKYGEGRSRPGMTTQVNPRPGKSISDAFHTSKPAILSQEIEPLRVHLDQDAQFVTGSFPSVYGGPAQGGSKTASEYSQSRSVALQRLGTVWKIIANFWTNFQSKSVVEYANYLKRMNRDEKFSQKMGDTFVNTWIKISSLNGKVGQVEPESDEQLPSSWAQKKDVIMQLFGLGMPEIAQVLGHPRNIPMVKTAFGLDDLFIPGEDDRTRQYKEFSILKQGMPVPTNPEIDTNEIHIEVLKSILNGPIGDTLSEEGRNACMMHLMEHQQNMMPQMGPLPQMGNMNQGQGMENMNQNQGVPNVPTE